jgi:hypothetical protein
MDKENRARSRLHLAEQLFREFYGSCFWHLKPDLAITSAHILLIVKGLREHGGRAGMLAADQLLAQADR